MKRNAIAFHSSRGPIGSIYRTQDGKHYARTPFGHRELDPSVGPSLAGRQVFYNRVMQSYVRATLWIAGVVFALGVFAGAVGYAHVAR